MAYKINQPPIGITVPANPSTEELAHRSNNKFHKRKSLNGRKQLIELNGFAIENNDARKAVADVYPAGLDTSLDTERERGGLGHISQ